MSMIVWASLSFMGVDAIVAVVPGGSDGALRAVLDGTLTDETIPLLIERSLWIGVGSLILAAGLGAVAAVFTRRE